MEICKIRALNSYLDKVYAKLLDCHTKLSEKDKIISPQAIKSLYLGLDQEHKTLEPVFTKISNQKMNTYLKEIASSIGIRKNISFHSARHTFATTVTLGNGVPIETVSKLLGHTKLATTQIYARVLEQKLNSDMENWLVY